MSRARELFHCCIKCSAHTVVHAPMSEKLPRHSYAKTCWKFMRPIQPVRNGSGVEMVVTANGLIENARVAHCLSERPDLIERGYGRNDARAGDAPIGRFQPDHATIARWISHRPSGVGAQSGDGEVRGNG